MDAGQQQGCMGPAGRAGPAKVKGSWPGRGPEAERALHVGGLGLFLEHQASMHCTCTHAHRPTLTTHTNYSQRAYLPSGSAQGKEKHDARKRNSGCQGSRPERPPRRVRGRITISRRNHCFPSCPCYKTHPASCRASTSGPWSACHSPQLTVVTSSQDDKGLETVHG